MKRPIQAEAASSKSTQSTRSAIVNRVRYIAFDDPEKLQAFEVPPSLPLRAHADRA